MVIHKAALFALGIIVCCAAFLLLKAEPSAQASGAQFTLKNVIAKEMKKEISVYATGNDVLYGVLDEVGDDYFRLSNKGESEERSTYIALSSVKYVSRSDRFITITLR